ncbi:MAG TPA: HAMP domain-containing histidine kinase, partial [Helicobacteraceae bacterium]|nr:HAMP domain-containing histidine kinase [Helicobacteraceae bacterium]
SEAKKHLTQTEILNLKAQHLKTPHDVITQSNARLHGEYFKPFGWYIFHGFDHARLDHAIAKQQQALSEDLEEEFTLIVGFSIIIALLVATLSILASRRINKIFLNYREAVQLREERLQEWAATLEKRVQEEVQAHQEKERMLIQQSKMAAMGDMISMIAHQWRQPLNQMSYVFMNIEGAYEYKELTPEYLDGKIKEGTKLLEYMSHTIDDFRNFFRPDKARELISVDEVIEETIPLIEKSFEAHDISLQRHHNSVTQRLMYRNELMQVLLNILKNAKDALIEKEVHPAMIHIKTAEDDTALHIEICDNAGGIASDVIDKIFEPYFTTKESNSGTGLGLYMSRTIIQEHFMGQLECYNEDGGACFKIVIPKA